MYKAVELELQSVHGIQESMEAMRLPKKSKSDTIKGVLGVDDARLAGNLIRAGNDHAKAIRGIIAYIRIKMQVGFMIEFETYRHGVECLSTSSTMHNELKALSGEELANEKQKALNDLVYKRSITVSYQALRSMYKARRNHRHPDWQVFCDFIENMPYFRELIMPTRENKTKT